MRTLSVTKEVVIIRNIPESIYFNINQTEIFLRLSLPQVSLHVCVETQQKVNPLMCGRVLLGNSHNVRRIRRTTPDF